MKNNRNSIKEANSKWRTGNRRTDRIRQGKTYLTLRNVIRVKLVMVSLSNHAPRNSILRPSAWKTPQTWKPLLRMTALLDYLYFRFTAIRCPLLAFSCSSLNPKPRTPSSFFNDSQSLIPSVIRQGKK